METQVDFKTMYPIINKNFFENIISNDKNAPVRVEEFTLTGAIGKGENFGSNMLRAIVNYKTVADSKQSVKFVIKIQTTDEVTAQLLREMKAFETEIGIYEEILPEVDKLLSSIGGDHHTKVSPICFASSSAEPAYLVFEDLNDSGYENVNRRSGLDFEHYKHVFSKLAAYHAATAVLLKQDPSKADLFINADQQRKSNLFKQMLENSFELLKDVTKSVPGYESLHETVNRISDETILEMLTSTFKSNDKQFNVLCHSDLWANNIMFRHGTSTKVVEDVLLVDYQLAKLNTPAADLAYCILTSFDENLGESSWNVLLEHYHTTLMQILDKFEFKDRRITLPELHEQFLSQSVFACLIGIIGMGTRKLEDTGDNKGLDHFIAQTEEGRQFRLNMMLRKACEKELITILNFIRDHGVFEQKYMLM